MSRHEFRYLSQIASRPVLLLLQPAPVGGQFGGWTNVGRRSSTHKKNMTKPGCVPTRSRTRSRAGSWPWPRRACAGGKDEDGTASDASPNRQARCWSPPGSANRARRVCPWARSIASSWRAFTPDETTGASSSLDSNVCYPKCTDPLTLRVHLPDCHSMQRHGKYASSSFRAAFFAPDLSHVGMDL